MAIYDSGSGHQLHLLDLDPLILPQVRLALSASASSSGVQPTVSQLLYQQVLWSPDGSTVATVFDAAGTSGGKSSATIATGILLTDPRTQHPRILVHSPGNSAPTLWDVRNAAWVGTPTVPPALGYSWGANGSLSPQTPLTTTAPPSIAPGGSVGNPDGGTSFTVWQPGNTQAPGDVELVLTAPGQQQIEVPGVYTWQTSFAAWSPDGRYLITDLASDGRLQPSGVPAPSAQTLTDFGLAQWPLLPVRDASVQELLAALSPTTSSYPKLLAWRPDGQVLAVQTLAYDVTADPTSAFVTFYNAGTGEALGSLRTGTGGSFETSVNLLRWSPDGQRLLVYDHQHSTITIWGPGLIPH